MGRNKIILYLWIIQTIHENAGLTKTELKDLWLKSDLNYNHKPIAERSFFDYIRDIESIFGVTIECDRSDHNKYYIIDSEAISKNRINSWLLSSFSVHNMMLESKNLSRRIVYEKIPSGNDYLIKIMGAMKDGVCLEMSYQGFVREKPHTVLVEPYCVKVFKQRWYMIAHLHKEDQIRIYALDRIHQLDRTSEKFDYPQWFDVDDYFKDSYGITVDPSIAKVECVRIKVFDRNHTCAYLKSLPLHHSQKEVLRNDRDNYSVFEYHLKPTYDFIQEILSLGSEVEVLSPDSVRNQCAEHIKQLYHAYFKSEE